MSEDNKNSEIIYHMTNIIEAQSKVSLKLTFTLKLTKRVDLKKLEKNKLLILRGRFKVSATIDLHKISGNRNK